MDEIDWAFLFIIIGQIACLIWAGTRLWKSRMKIKKLDREMISLSKKWQRKRDKQMSKEWFGTGMWEDYK